MEINTNKQNVNTQNEDTSYDTMSLAQVGRCVITFGQLANNRHTSHTRAQRLLYKKYLMTLCPERWTICTNLWGPTLTWNAPIFYYQCSQRHRRYYHLRQRLCWCFVCKHTVLVTWLDLSRGHATSVHSVYCNGGWSRLIGHLWHVLQHLYVYFWSPILLDHPLAITDEIFLFDVIPSQPL